ncbi:MAG: GUN4 domain-containing protein [Leptolyngbyaceae cyanobacterium]
MPEARFFDALRKYFPMPVDTADSLAVKTVVEEKIPPVPRPSVEMPTKPTEIELKSDKGVDYQELQRLLQEKKWRKADIETIHRMAEALGLDQNDPIRSKALQTFPCADLKTIDALWKHYSCGKFSYSVQKNIWQECGSPTDVGKDWDRFCARIGWKNTNGNYSGYSKLTADPNFSPLGEFPYCGRFVGWGRLGIWIVNIRTVSSLLARLVNCDSDFRI